MFLKTDGAGNLSFSSSLPASSVGVTQLSATGSPSSSTFLRGDNSWASAGATAGQVIQVVSTTKTDVFSTTSTSYTDVTGLSVSITPSSASNKILVILTSNFSSSVDDSLMQLVRNSTIIGNGTSGTSKNGFAMMATAVTVNSIITSAINFLDSPATTSSTTYKVQLVTNSGTVYVNRRHGNDSFGGSSTITVMEIKG